MSFDRASVHLEDLAEAIEDSDIVQVSQLLDGFEREHPGTAFALFHRGNLARLEGREADATKLFREAIEKAPRSAPVWNNLGVLLAMRGGERERGGRRISQDASDPGRHDRTALEEPYPASRPGEAASGSEGPKFRHLCGSAHFLKRWRRGSFSSCRSDPDQLLNYGEQLLRDGLAGNLGFQAIQRAHQLRPDHRRIVFALTAANRLGGKIDEALAASSLRLHGGASGRPGRKAFSILPRSATRRGIRRARPPPSVSPARHRSECAGSARHPLRE